MAQTNFPMIDLQATGQRIKEVRQQKGITVKTLQTFLGFNEPVSIYKWQRGECLPTFDNMYAMACLFGVGIDDLLVGNRQEVVFLCFYSRGRRGQAPPSIVHFRQKRLYARKIAKDEEEAAVKETIQYIREKNLREKEDMPEDSESAERKKE